MTTPAASGTAASSSPISIPTIGRRPAARAPSAALAPGGYALIGGFAPDGPERCSGLPVVRRSGEQITALFGSAFRPVRTHAERHRTPSGVEQSFAYALLRRA